MSQPSSDWPYLFKDISQWQLGCSLIVQLGFAAYRALLKPMGCLKALTQGITHMNAANRLENLHSVLVFKHKSKWEPTKMISALYHNSGTMKWKKF